MVRFICLDTGPLNQTILMSRVWDGEHEVWVVRYLFSILDELALPEVRVARKEDFNY